MAPQLSLSSTANGSGPDGPGDHRHDEIKALLENAGEVRGDRRAAVFGIERWHALLSSPDPNIRAQVREFLGTMGYLPNTRAVSYATRTNGSVANEMRALVNAVVGGQLEPAALVAEAPAQLAQRLSVEHGLNISPSRVTVLQDIVEQELRLYSQDISGLAQRFPFDITRENFFGRFVAGGCDEPQQAIRRLQLATPFFVGMLSVIEGLRGEKKRFLNLDKLARDDKGHLESTALRENEIDMIKACIDRSQDFCGHGEREKVRGLACLDLPDLPWINLSEIEDKERRQLAREFFDWLFFGNESGELMNRKALLPSQEDRHKKSVQELDALERRLREMSSNKPAADVSALDLGTWSKKFNRVDNRIELLRERLDTMDAQRKAVKTVRQQLEENAVAMTEVRALRKKISEVAKTGKRVVFISGFKPRREKPSDKDKREDSVDIIADTLDSAYSSAHLAQESMGIKLLRDSAFLLSDAQVEAIPRTAGGNSLHEQQFRALSFDETDFNSSLEFVMAGILPEKRDAQVTLLMDCLRKELKIPGILNRSDMAVVIREWSGRRNPKIDDYLIYAFEHAPYMSQRQLLHILHAARELGVTELPPRCRELAENRFRLSAQLITDFATYSTSYRPDTVGAPPMQFTDRATLEAFHNLHLDAYGMDFEVKQLVALLEEHGVVAIVDSTEYHPELVKTVGQPGAEEQEKSDVESSDQLWGRYVRPSERLVRAFSLRLMEGDVPEALRNHSLMEVRKPSDEQKAFVRVVKAFFGIDLHLTPDLAEINNLLESLTLHNGNTILVVDAAQVTDLEQYRAFIDLLRQYNVKVILRMREPLPGAAQVLVDPFLSHEIPERLAADAVSFSRKLGLSTPIADEVLCFAARQVENNRAPGDDPLNLTLQLLNGAAQNVRMHGRGEVTTQDVAAAMPPIFHLPDAERMRSRIRVIDAFVNRAPGEVLGQKNAIRRMGDAIKSHILGLGDPRRPLNIMMPGPTGVGKTELAMRFALAAGLPFFPIEGSQYGESHTLSRLIGSPNGYVGPNEGALFKFARDNVLGIVFIDEVGKMHPDVLAGLMNFFDIGVLTSGDSKSVRRPGLIIISATNAGALQLTPEMTDAEVKEVLAQELVDNEGRSRPELVARFDPIPMLAISRDDFKEVLRLELRAIGNRQGFIMANLRLEPEVDDATLELLFMCSRQACAFNENSLGHKMKPGFRGSGPIDLSSLGERFFDLRYVSRQVQRLGGESMRRLVEEQIRIGRNNDGSEPRRVKFRVRQDGEALELVDAA